MEGISKESLQRLPTYLRYLNELHLNGIESVSSTTIADRFKLNPVTVRKDLAFISEDGGKPKTGFSVADLVAEISEFLGYNNTQDAVLVGVGKLGSALLGYKGFSNYGLNIVASFDCKTDIQIDSTKREINNISMLPDLVKRLGVNIGIITVPAESAQAVCDLMINSGIKAIWNFSPTHLITPDNIAIKNEDMAASLAVLSQRLTAILKNE
ncbi:MAG: redox-sensing transcriptional repressor Rex [Clostridia bacterium]|nr:redox-sensing transcriptional repressor Rex [Clostridia bacterium]